MVQTMKHYETKKEKKKMEKALYTIMSDFQDIQYNEKAEKSIYCISHLREENVTTYIYIDVDVCR